MQHYEITIGTNNIDAVTIITSQHSILVQETPEKIELYAADETVIAYVKEGLLKFADKKVNLVLKRDNDPRIRLTGWVVFESGKIATIYFKQPAKPEAPKVAPAPIEVKQPEPSAPVVSIPEIKVEEPKPVISEAPAIETPKIAKDEKSAPTPKKKAESTEDPGTPAKS